MEYREYRYLTDDRDMDRRYELVAMHAPNGDYYVGSVPEGNPLTTGVRFCTSGGVSTKSPRLSRAIFELFQALKEAQEKGVNGIEPGRESS